MPSDDLFDFAYLEPRGTRRFTLDAVHVYSADPVVLVLEYAAPGSPSRAAYESAKLKDTKNDDLLRIVAPLVVRDWSNVCDKAKVPVPYSPAAMQSMVDGLVKHRRADILWNAMLYALNPNNFRDTPSAEQLGKA